MNKLTVNKPAIQSRERPLNNIDSPPRILWHVPGPLGCLQNSTNNYIDLFRVINMCLKIVPVFHSGGSRISLTS